MSANVSRAFCDLGYGAIWMPVTFMSYMLDVSLFGDNWYAYHSVNVLFHLVNAWLVFLFLKNQSRLFVPDNAVHADMICAVCALLWALHPMRAEGVTFVASRKEELWTFFSLCGLLQYGRFIRGGGVRHYIAVVALFVLAGMSKPTAICFPFLAFVMHLAMRRGTERRSFIWLAPLVAMSVGLGFLTVYSQSHPTNAVPIDVYDAKLPWRLLNAVVATGLYFWYTFVPTGIHLDYRAVFNGWPIDGWLGITCFCIVAGCVILVLAMKNNSLKSAMAYTTLLFSFSLGPTLGVFGYVNGDQAMADRYMYFPHVAVVLMISICMIRFAGSSSSRFKWVMIVMLLATFAEAVCAVPVVKSYENSYTACSRALTKDPCNWRALRIVGNEYCARLNRTDEGIAMLRKSLRIRGSQQTADSLAYVLAIRGKSGDFTEVKRWGAPIAANPSLDEGGMMLDALGIVAMREGEYRRAAKYFAEGLSAHKRNHSRDFSELYLGLCLANVGEDLKSVSILTRLGHSRVEYVRRRAANAVKVIKTGKRRTPFMWE